MVRLDALSHGHVESTAVLYRLQNRVSGAVVGPNFQPLIFKNTTFFLSHSASTGHDPWSGLSALMTLLARLDTNKEILQVVTQEGEV